MKVIISHDVDHLFRNDHYKDLIYPKLWVRSTLELAKKDLSLKEWFYRMGSPFNKVRHRIFDVTAIDKEYNIPSSFFFGMENGLGMNYNRMSAVPIINELLKEGFDVGVHGVAYNDFNSMQKEYEYFEELVLKKPVGIRMHYVRFDNTTFDYLSKIGYSYDTSEFDKSKGYLIKSPYKINGMWEFPLTIMDGYLPPHFDDMKDATLKIIQEAENRKLQFITILFHDYLFSNAYATSREWYKWLIDWLYNNKFEFASYADAIRELEGNNIG